MQAFVCDCLPRSVNPRGKAERKAEYYKSLITAFRKYHADTPPLESCLYGIVYYFHKAKTQLDADNLSKPVWDALRGAAFTDDFQIRFRSAGLFNFGAEKIEELDLTNMPDYVLDDFLIMLDSRKHILYVEFGEFSYDLIQFGIDK
jgi:Holliday junction resolvase RusA-like endonuclease